MIGFWISASLMIAAALAFLMPPLVGRLKSPDISRDAVNLAIYRERRQELEVEHTEGGLDDERFAAALAELDRELLRDMGDDEQAGDAHATRSPYPAIVVAVLLPMLAFGLYLKLGAPETLMMETGAGGAGAAAGAGAGTGRGEIPHSVQEMVAGLERKLQESPDDPDGWVMLGRSFAAMNQLDKARSALAEANRRRPDHSLTMLALAEVMAGQQGNRLDGEPIALVERVLAVDANQPRALWLAGVHAFNSDDRERARELWQRLLDQGSLSPEAAAQVREAVAQTGAPDPAGSARPAAPASAGTEPAAGGASVTVTVSLAPELAERVDGSETLFVFARAASGPRMPLAIARLSAAELPTTVTLDESMAMAPQMTIATFPQVVVGARISRSGNATPSSGDLQGTSAPLAPADGPKVALTIDQVVP